MPRRSKAYLTRKARSRTRTKARTKKAGRYSPPPLPAGVARDASAVAALCEDLLPADHTRVCRHLLQVSWHVAETRRLPRGTTLFIRKPTWRGGELFPKRLMMIVAADNPVVAGRPREPKAVRPFDAITMDRMHTLEAACLRLCAVLHTVRSAAAPRADDDDATSCSSVASSGSSTAASLLPQVSHSLGNRRSALYAVWGLGRLSL